MRFKVKELNNFADHYRGNEEDFSPSHDAYFRIDQPAYVLYFYRF